MHPSGQTSWRQCSLQDCRRYLAAEITDTEEVEVLYSIPSNSIRRTLSCHSPCGPLQSDLCIPQNLTVFADLRKFQSVQLVVDCLVRRIWIILDESLKKSLKETWEKILKKSPKKLWRKLLYWMPEKIQGRTLRVKLGSILEKFFKNPWGIPGVTQQGIS